jgi:hypothetical protein
MLADEEISGVAATDKGSCAGHPERIEGSRIGATDYAH